MHICNFSPTQDWLNKKLTCTQSNIIFKIREALGRMAASEQLKWTWDWPHRIGGGGVRERERDLLLPSHHQQVGEKERNNLKQQLAMTIVPPAHLLIVTRGWVGGEGWVKEGLGLRWGEDEVGSRREQHSREVEKEMWVVTNYFTVQRQGGRGLGGGVMKALGGSSDLMWPERNLTERMQHNEIKRRH